MPTARELLEQADALMRRNRERAEAERLAKAQAKSVALERPDLVEAELEVAPADGERRDDARGEDVRDEDIPELTDAVALEVAPVIDLRPAVSALDASFARMWARSGGAIPSGEFDKDNRKNFALRLSRPFGPARIGLFGYFGKEEGGASSTIDEVRYLGPDVTLSFGDRWELNAEYLERSDNNPLFLARGATEFKTRGGFAELLFFPQGSVGKWSVAALYNQIDSDDAAAVRDDIAFSVGYLTARNVRILVEAGRDLENDKNRLSAGLVTAF